MSNGFHVLQAAEVYEPGMGNYQKNLLSSNLFLPARNLSLQYGQKSDFILPLSMTKVEGQSMATFFPGAKEWAVVPYPGLFTRQIFQET